MDLHARQPKDLVYPNDPQFGHASPGKIGMWIFLVTDGMAFSGFLIAYAVLRTQKNWPNVEQALGGVGISAFMTFLLIVTSLTMVLSIDACRRLEREKMLKWLLGTIIGGGLFLLLQVYEYTHLIVDKKIYFSTFTQSGELFNHFGSTFYSITGFHGLHVLSGVLYLTYMYKLGKEGRFDHGNYQQLNGRSFLALCRPSLDIGLHLYLPLMRIFLWTFFLVWADLALACPGCVGTAKDNSGNTVVIVLGVFILLCYVPMYYLFRLIIKYKNINKK